MMIETKRVNILVPNATSPKNIGDQAMLEVLIELVRAAFKNASISVHSADPNLHKNRTYKVKHTLYSWSVFRDRKTTARIINVLKLISQYIFLKFGMNNRQVDRKLDDLITDYKKADLIIFAAGGYLRSKKGLTQSLNLMMQVFPFMMAALFPAKKIVAPISVGPFGYSWQEKIVVSALRQMNLVFLREEFSYNALSKYKMKNIAISSDYALMVKKINSKGPQKLTLGFTLREWLRGEKSLAFEKFFVDAIIKFSQETGARVQPIVQVSASKYGEDDVAVTKKIVSKLKAKNITVLKVRKITSVKDGLAAYSNVDILLGMRMHSNILAAVQGTPFAAISYEYKTEGIARNLGMEKYCIKCEEIDSTNLYRLLVDVYKKRASLKNKLSSAIRLNQYTENKKWSHYLSQ